MTTGAQEFSATDCDKLAGMEDCDKLAGMDTLLEDIGCGRGG